MLYATVRQRKIHVKNPVTVIQNGVNVDELILEMDDEWVSMDSIVAVFTLKYTETETKTETVEKNDGTTEEVTTTVTVSKELSKEVLHTFGKPLMVPWECLEKTGRLMVSCTGYVNETKVMTTMYPDSFWNVVQNGPKEGDTPLDPTPTLYERVLAAANAANSAAIEANEAKSDLLTAKENGDFNGKDGRGIVSVQLTRVVRPSTGGGGYKVYTITFTDDTKYEFTVENGDDGEDGDDGRGIRKIELEDNNLKIIFTDGLSTLVPFPEISGGSGNVSSPDIDTIRVLDRAEYEALAVPRPAGTVYLIKG